MHLHELNYNFFILIGPLGLRVLKAKSAKKKP